MATEQQLAANLQAFETYNRSRIETSIQISPKTALLAIHLVPMMLHYNHHGLPCYLECGEYCGGISFFELTEDMKTALKHSVKDFKSIELDMRRHAVDEIEPFIESLLLMGSVGSAAQSSVSDYDYWVVVNESRLNGKKMNSLKEKLGLIEKWAEKNGAEFHFFITDVNRVRRNDFGGAGKESVGTAQAGILKEEFYRTSLHVAGKYPLWWLTTPAADDDEYNSVIKDLDMTWEVNLKQFVDLGNMAPITIGEFFGAALWQINKAMDSPFKSVLKMALLESFIDSEGESIPLCEELKKNILSPDSPAHLRDPYLIMIDRLLDHYHHKNRGDVVELLRKCFYNKVSIKINAATKRKSKRTYKEELMLYYINEWNWGESVTANLNKYDEWDFDRVLDLGKQLHSFLLETWKNLTNSLKTREDVKNLISDEDLTILGRKLFSFYNKKKAKIEPLKRASDEALRLESCTFMPAVQRGKKTVWTVFRGNVTTEIARKDSVQHAELKKGASLADIIAWLVMNRLIDSKTFLHLIPNPLPVSLKEIQGLVKVIGRFLPYQQISAIENRYLLQEAFVTGIIVIVNFTSQLWTKSVDEITLLYRNSHGEVFCETHNAKSGHERLLKILSETNPKIDEDMHSLFHIFVPRSENSVKMEKQVRGVVLSNLKQKSTATS
ncbi:MAG: adenylate cyclase [bacterium]|nr:MAG: adenylate cyclase [bacterium]